MIIYCINYEFEIFVFQQLKNLIMKHNKTTAKIKTISLKKFENWNQWFKNLKIFVSEKFWSLIDFDFFQFFLILFFRFLIQNVNRTAKKIFAFTKFQQKIYENMLKIFVEKYKIYTKKQTVLTIIKIKIQKTVFLIKRIDLQSIDTMKKWFKTLKIAIRFFIEYLMTMIKKKYDSLFKFRIKSLKWLSRWKIAIVSIKQYEFFEFKKNVWLHNFVA